MNIGSKGMDMLRVFSSDAYQSYLSSFKELCVQRFAISNGEKCIRLTSALRFMHNGYLHKIIPPCVC
jgi:oxalate decarboxylase/phosphoglucose isomerase-like protein (cupin superfamily)